MDTPEQLTTALLPVTSLFPACAILLAAVIAYSFHTDPLKHVPGPLICKITSLWSWYHSAIGDEAKQIDNLHKKYGPVLRISPGEVVISDGAALAPVYSEKGGFLKAHYYANFDSEGHETIFSTLDPGHRSVRSKAVMPMFSTSNIRARISDIQACTDNLVARLQNEAEKSRQAFRDSGKATPVNILDVSRRLAIDAVTTYLFGKDFNGINENANGKLSASSFVESIVMIGRLFFFPPWLAIPLFTLAQRLHPPSPEVDASAAKVNGFTASLVEIPPRDDTYQSRLLRAGCSDHETDVQMKDVIFAGTDTSGTNLAVLIHHLAKYPDVVQRLRDEITETEGRDGLEYNPQNLKYLDTVVREGLRISMANPCRFPRQVPPSGFNFTLSDGRRCYLPPGTVVGLQPFTLHFNPEIFPDPHAFKPGRWLDASPEMLRDAIPFGLGPRQCIAKNLAMFELHLAIRAIAKSNVLHGAQPVQDRIKTLQWFNAKIVGDRIDLVWE